MCTVEIGNSWFVCWFCFVLKMEKDLSLFIVWKEEVNGLMLRKRQRGTEEKGRNHSQDEKRVFKEQ